MGQEMKLSHITTSADVCTPKRPRRTAAPKLPYPDLPDGETGSAFWLIHTQRTAAKVAALRKHASSVCAKKKDGPLSGALWAAIRLLDEELSRDQKNLADALESEARGVPA